MQRSRDGEQKEREGPGLKKRRDPGLQPERAPERQSNDRKEQHSQRRKLMARRTALKKGRGCRRRPRRLAQLSRPGRATGARKADEARGAEPEIGESRGRPGEHGGAKRRSSRRAETSMKAMAQTSIHTPPQTAPKTAATNQPRRKGTSGAERRRANVMAGQGALERDSRV